MRPGSTQQVSEKQALAESQFREALSRVGTGLEKNAKWFLTFCGCHILCRSLEKRVQLWHDLLSLMILAARPDASKAGAPLTNMERDYWQYLEAWPFEHSPKTGSIKLRTEYQGWWNWVDTLRFQVDQIIDDVLVKRYSGLQLTNVSLSLEVGPHGLVPVFPLDMFVQETKDGSRIRGADGAVLIRLACVLQRCGDNIHGCPACNTTFLATRKDQEFCTSTCRSRVGMQRWRAKQAARTKPKSTSPKSNRKHTSPHPSSSKGDAHGTKRRH